MGLDIDTGSLTAQKYILTDAGLALGEASIPLLLQVIGSNPPYIELF